MTFRKKLPKNYYYFAHVHYKNGDVKEWRFVDKNARRSAVATFKRDKNVSNVQESEGFKH